MATNTMLRLSRGSPSYGVSPIAMILMSNRKESNLFDFIDALSKPKVEQAQVSKSQFIIPSLLKDIPTINMTFTFGFNSSAWNVALWGHQSIISQQQNLSSFMSKLQDVECDPSFPEAACGVKTTHVTEYSLKAHCALVRYLYTSDSELEVDMNDFAIGQFAYKYKDTKALLLEYVFGSMDMLSDTDHDPFEAYKDHPEKHSLMIKAMQRKFRP
ncbi:hypothetical protein BG000_009590 [Podila horticola]|nr:hypothetical protein BG000_009590 [Podila horticola]